MKANTKPTWSSRIQAPRRKINLYPATPAVRQSPEPPRPTRTRSGSASWLRSHCDPDHPEKYDKADERNEGHAKRIGVGQDHTGASSIIPIRLRRISARLSALASMSWDAKSISIEIARSSSRRIASQRKITLFRRVYLRLSFQRQWKLQLVVGEATLPKDNVVRWLHGETVVVEPHEAELLGLLRVG